MKKNQVQSKDWSGVIAVISGIIVMILMMIAYKQYKERQEYNLEKGKERAARKAKIALNHTSFFAVKDLVEQNILDNKLLANISIESSEEILEDLNDGERFDVICYDNVDFIRQLKQNGVTDSTSGKIVYEDDYAVLVHKKYAKIAKEIAGNLTVLEKKDFNFVDFPLSLMDGVSVKYDQILKDNSRQGVIMPAKYAAKLASLDTTLNQEKLFKVKKYTIYCIRPLGGDVNLFNQTIAENGNNENKK